MPKSKPCQIPLDSASDTCHSNAQSAVGVTAPEQPVVVPVHQKRGIQEHVSHSPDVAMCPDKILLHWLWNETNVKLDILAGHVREGESLDTALFFAQFITWSGLIKLFETYPNAGGLKVDGPIIRWKCDELQRNVRDHYKATGKREQPVVARTQLEAINHKLDLIAGRLAQISPSLKETSAAGVVASPPALQVIQGGAS